METFSWTFVRGDNDGERLTIIRETDEKVRMTIATNDSARVIEFNDLVSAVRFQSDMEAFLVKSGWSFIKFEPERRSGRDRRELPRLFERRRWWTDGMATPAELLKWLDTFARGRR